MKIYYLLLATLLVGCANLDSPDNSIQSGEDFLVKQMVSDFFCDVNPGSRAIDGPTIKKVSRTHYQIVGDTVIEVQSRANVDSTTFDIATVEFELRGNDGFAIVSDDERINQVLFYTENGTLEQAKEIEPLQDLMQSYPQMALIQPDSIKVGGQITPNDSIISGELIGGGIGNGNVLIGENDPIPALILNPIVPYCWGQGYPFNICTPEINGQKAPIGCVTIATAQTIATIGKFKGTFYGTKNINFAGLPQKGKDMTESQKQQVASFCHEIALCCQIQFGATQSGAFIKAVYHYLTDMGYQCVYEEGAVNIRKVINEINQGYPHLIAGRNDTDGHMWVIDGVITRPTYQYHCNWGWNGTCDGWTTSTPFTATGINSEGEITETIFNKNIQNIYINSINF